MSTGMLCSLQVFLAMRAKTAGRRDKDEDGLERILAPIKCCVLSIYLIPFLQNGSKWQNLLGLLLLAQSTGSPSYLGRCAPQTECQPPEKAFVVENKKPVRVENTYRQSRKDTISKQSFSATMTTLVTINGEKEQTNSTQNIC